MIWNDLNCQLKNHILRSRLTFPVLINFYTIISLTEHYNIGYIVLIIRVRIFIILHIFFLVSILVQKYVSQDLYSKYKNFIYIFTIFFFFLKVHILYGLCFKQIFDDTDTKYLFVVDIWRVSMVCELYQLLHLLMRKELYRSTKTIIIYLYEYYFFHRDLFSNRFKNLLAPNRCRYTKKNLKQTIIVTQCNYCKNIFYYL